MLSGNLMCQNGLALFGRIGLAVIFIIAGTSKIFGYDATVDSIADVGLPLAEIGAVVAILIELVGGLLLLIGWKTRYAALVIALFVLVVMFTFHPFWTYTNSEMIGQMYQFLKNLAIVGGLLYVMAFGAGQYSVDGIHIKSSAN